ncbi:MAG: hypothetical protein LBN40_00190 [Oscillospiraceae bacterium]|jgi:hypothetical protein|nr:hypothetical protein [Oscillospiraceae bacterium]
MPSIPQITNPVSTKTLTSGTMTDRQSTSGGEQFDMVQGQRPVEAVKTAVDTSAGKGGKASQKDFLPLLVKTPKDPTMAVESLKQIISDELLSVAKSNGYTELYGELEGLMKSIYLKSGEVADEILTQEKQTTMFGGDKLFDLLRSLSRNAEITGNADALNSVGGFLKAVNFLRGNNDILKALSSNMKFLSGYFTPSKQLSHDLEVLSKEWSSPDAPKYFETLKTETLGVLKNVSQSVLNNERTGTLLPLIVHNLSRYNTNASMLSEGFSQVLTHVAGQAARNEFTEAFDGFVNKFFPFEQSGEDNGLQMNTPQRDAVNPKAANGITLNGQQGSDRQEFQTLPPMQTGVLGSNTPQQQNLAGRPLVNQNTGGFNDNAATFENEPNIIMQANERPTGAQAGQTAVQQQNGQTEQNPQTTESSRNAETTQNRQTSQAPQSTQSPQTTKTTENQPLRSAQTAANTNLQPQFIPNRVPEIIGRAFSEPSFIAKSEFSFSEQGELPPLGYNFKTEDFPLPTNRFYAAIDEPLDDYNAGKTNGMETVRRILENVSDEDDPDIRPLISEELERVQSITGAVNYLNDILRAMPDGDHQMSLFDNLSKIINQMAAESELPPSVPEDSLFDENGLPKLPPPRNADELANEAARHTKPEEARPSKLEQLVSFVDRNIDHAALKTINNYNASNLLQSLINAPGVFTPLAHYIIPLQIDDARAFGELWVDNDEEDDSTSSSVTRAERKYHLFLTFEVESVGRFEVDTVAQGKDVSIAFYHPESYAPKAATLSGKIKRIAADCGYNAENFLSLPLVKPKNLLEVFPSISESRKGFNVKA